MDQKKNVESYEMVELTDGVDPIEWFKTMAENAIAVQSQTLRRILEQNCKTEYLQKWLGEELQIHDLEDSELETLYRNSVPLATHADFEPYIHRIANGDTNPILTQKPIASLTLTTGTSEGTQKYIPFTDKYKQIFLHALWVEITFTTRVYPIKEGGKVLSFWYNNTQSKSTKGGLSVASVATLLMKNLLKTNESMFYKYCCPCETFSIGEYKQLTYCHLLLGLHFSEEVELVSIGFTYAMVVALTSFEELWRELCRDIKEGTTGHRIECPRLREAILDILRSPNPSLASVIEDKCKVLEGSGWFGLIPMLWPNAKFVSGVMSGSMEIYAKKLRHYAGNNLPLVCPFYMTSESFIGINIDSRALPENTSFTLFPSASYFEFIPLHNYHSGSMEENNYIDDEPISFSQLKVGQEYDIVLTTFTGLYRYELGDIVRVVGFHKKTPKLKFVQRRNVLLSVTIDKSTEDDLQTTVHRASEILIAKTETKLVGFTSHADVATQPGRYVIFWEIKGEINDMVLQECCTEMDKSFGNFGYVMCRRSETIGALELCVVERGSFDRVLDWFVESGGSVSQFKIPSCVKSQAVLKILEECTVMRFYSNAYGYDS